MTQEGDEAEVQEDEMVRKEHEVEKKRELEPDFEEHKENKQKALMEKEMDNAEYKDSESAIEHYSKKGIRYQ